MTIGSLFSGIIGGLELGLEWAGLGPTLWQVEREPFCRVVLEKHWPEARRFDDVCAVGAAELAPVDLICGGFPCQDVSSAGSRAGLAGARSGLWREFARIVSELRPSWVVVENVTSGARRWVDAVVSDLGQLGYACLPIPVRADALGAPYQRARVFVVALARASGDDRGQQPEAARVASRTREAPDAHGSELRQQPGRWGRARGQGAPVASVNRWREPMPPVGGMVPGAADGLARRAGGNCVVPQCAEVVGWVIRELLETGAGWEDDPAPGGESNG